MEREDSKLDKLVLDSSVIIKWFSQEQDTEKAIAIRERLIQGDIIIAAPDIQLYEIANALRYNSRLKEQDVKEAIESLLDIGVIIIIPTREVIKLAIELAYKFDITIYDAYFIALAKELKFTFITADEKLYGKVSSLDFAMLLKNIKN